MLASLQHLITIFNDEKIAYARNRKLNCRTERAFEHLDGMTDEYDVIIPEQELNHLTHAETLEFLGLCHRALKPGGLLLVYGLNGANQHWAADVTHYPDPSRLALSCCYDGPLLPPHRGLVVGP